MPTNIYVVIIIIMLLFTLLFQGHTVTRCGGMTTFQSKCLWKTGTRRRRRRDGQLPGRDLPRPSGLVEGRRDEDERRGGRGGEKRREEERRGEKRSRWEQKINRQTESDQMSKKTTMHTDMPKHVYGQMDTSAKGHKNKWILEQKHW